MATAFWAHGKSVRKPTVPLTELGDLGTTRHPYFAIDLGMATADLSLQELSAGE